MSDSIPAADETSNQRCVIIGASHAGVSAALALRKEGWQGPVTLIGGERELPYHRPPLSKELLSGAKSLEQIALRPEKAYADNDIDLRLGVTVLGINREEKCLQLSDASSLAYDKLLLCTGADVITLPMTEGVAGVHSIRSHADVLAIKERLPELNSVAIVGAGYIGLEAAAVLRKHGCEVTVLELADRCLGRVTSPIMSDFMAALHQHHGVDLRTGVSVAELITEQQDGIATLTGLKLTDGSGLDADLMLVGIGVRANEGLASAAGLEVNNGVVVDSHCQSSDPDIFAAGDCTSHPSQLYERQIRLESVQNANDQGRVAAANICGRQQDYDAVPWFWSDQYDIKLQMVGISEGYDKVVIRGEASLDSLAEERDPSERGFALFYFRDGILIAADCVARPKEFMAAKQLVTRRSKIAPEMLMDEGIEPAVLMKHSD
jgi:3-phenylpropionate/trans-cinnamate dioxygenase ferredoxin reductase subunit